MSVFRQLCGTALGLIRSVCSRSCDWSFRISKNHGTCMLVSIAPLNPHLTIMRPSQRQEGQRPSTRCTTIFHPRTPTCPFNGAQSIRGGQIVWQHVDRPGEDDRTGYSWDRDNWRSSIEAAMRPSFTLLVGLHLSRFIDKDWLLPNVALSEASHTWSCAILMWL